MGEERAFGIAGRPRGEHHVGDALAGELGLAGSVWPAASLEREIAERDRLDAGFGDLIRTGPISSGKPGKHTPTGKFAVLGKDKDKKSSLYKNEIGTQAWMPYSLRFHGNYFIHEGWLRGYAASHGCIRLGYYDARLLFERMKIGDSVTVSN